jgi:hypothetical protein
MVNKTTDPPLFRDLPRVCGRTSCVQGALGERFSHVTEKQKSPAGTPENASLIVKLLQNEWVVEDEQGECLGSSKDRNSAIEIARQAQEAGRGATISIQGEDGAHEKTLD